MDNLEGVSCNQEFVDRVAVRTTLSRRDAASAVEAFLETVTESLKEGAAVTLIGFSKFWPQQRPGREAVNPRTRQKAMIPAAKLPRFSASAALKQAVRK